MKNFRILILSVFVFLSLIGNAQEANHLNLDKNIALDSYDLLSYFTMDKPLKGKKEFQFKYNGAQYYFSSEENRAAFENNPKAYEVVYGGWCAYAMGKNGEKVAIDPLTYKIIDGKLYLFYNKYFTNTLEKWNNDEIQLKDKADKNWLEIIKPN